MSVKRPPIPEELRTKLLLWSSRHCCFCGKSCTTNIEIHHIDNDHTNNIEDNLIPVCFDCHGELARYNLKHPKGINYKFSEIKNRRNQIYDQYTQQYVRHVDIKITNYIQNTQNKRTLGDVSFNVFSVSTDLPIQLKVNLSLYFNNNIQIHDFLEMYNGTTLWNLNPSQLVFAHFQLPDISSLNPFNIRLVVQHSIIDVMHKEHEMLPFSFVWNNKDDDWWYDPRNA